VSDTSPEIARLVAERFAGMTPAERIEIALSMDRTARQIVIASFPSGLTEAQVRRRLCARLYGEQLARRAYPGASEPA
jgi:hypothetical protein